MIGLNLGIRAASRRRTAPASSVPGTIDPSISAPELSLNTGQTTYPPKFIAALDDTAIVGDTVCLRQADDDAFTVNVVDYFNAVDAAEATDTSAGTTGKITFAGLSAIASGTHRFKACDIRGGVRSDWSNVVTHGPDDIAPVLSAGSATMVSATQGTVGFTTDTGEGNAYIVLTLGSTPPSKAQVKAGQNAGGSAAAWASGAKPITSAGAKSYGATGLTASTLYYAWVMHEDATGNQSNVLAAGSFTTDAAVAFSLTEVAAPNTQNIGFGSTTATFSALSFGAAQTSRYLIAAIDAYDGGNVPSSVTIGGVSATKIDSNDKLSVWIAAVPTGTSGNVVVTMPGSISFCGMKLWRMVGGNSAATQIVKLPKAFNNSPFQVSVTTPSGGATAVIGFVETLSGTASWSNATAASQVSNSNDSICSAIRTTAGAATVGLSGFGNQNSAMIAVSFGP